MGYMAHNAIVVTGCMDEPLEEARALAVEIFQWVSPISPPTITGFRSFLIPPDGSKEGWPESDAGDKARESYWSALGQLSYSDGSHPCSAVEVRFGGDTDRDTVEAGLTRRRT